MKKSRKIAILILALILIPAILYLSFKNYYSDASRFERRWELKLPKHSTVDEVFSTEIGWDGAGERILKIDIKNDNLKNTDFERETEDSNISQIEVMAIDKVMESARSSVKINRDQLEYVKAITKDANTLVITYSPSDDCYYAFEDLI